jgi:EmrB/QacA subfamily drug resistance transporter
MTPTSRPLTRARDQKNAQRIAAGPAPGRTRSTVPAPRRLWLALAVLAMADFVVILDASIVNVALPSIGKGLHLSQGGLSWVVNAYVLAFGGFLLLGGRIADVLGRRRVFIASLVVFAMASLAGGLAVSGGLLVAARGVQGLAAAALAPAALSLVTATFAEGPQRNRAMGIWGAVAGSGAAVGVLLGGVLTTGLGWRWILFVNVPVGIGCALAAPHLIAESRTPRAGQGFDVAGAVAITGGLGALVYGLVGASHAGWLSQRTAGSLALAAVLFAMFAVIERRSGSPLVPFSIFGPKVLRAANATMLATGAAVLSLFFILSLYEQQVLGYSALQAGLSQLPLAVTTIAAAGIAARLVSQAGIKTTLVAGLAVFAGGLAWLAQVTATSSFAAGILGPSLLVGAGLGLAFVSLTIGAVTGVPGPQAGLASGLINSSQQIGGAIGLAAAATIAAAQATHSLASGAPPGPALTGGFRLAFLTAAAFAALGAVTALTLTGSRRAAGPGGGGILTHAEETSR